MAEQTKTGKLISDSQSAIVPPSADSCLKCSGYLWSDTGCVDGDVLGPCASPNCYGRCEFKRDCDCECHDD